MILLRIIKAPQKITLFILRGYSNYISYFFPSACRFYPSCSHYAYDAIKIHGLFFGLYYSMRRLLHCHPWHQGGYDPAPEKTHFSLGVCCSKHTSCINIQSDKELL